MLSTYPPTQCGLATFAAALTRALVALPGCTVRVVRALDAAEVEPNSGVSAHLIAGDRLSQRRAADALNGTDVAVVQHEYGIYGGDDGTEVLSVLRQVSVPLVAVLHTVLSRPTASQRETLRAVCACANTVVVMSRAAHERLLRCYDVPPGKVIVIPHGVAPAFSRGRERPVPGRVLTWGLIGPGKGIEWGIDAMAALADLTPRPHYLVAGGTHPKVLQDAGESYRESLVDRAEALGIADLVVFDSSYRPSADLPALARSAAVVLLPYESDEQVTSGVLIEAVAAGRPVVASGFPHAVELLSTGAGITVPSRDASAMAAALREVLTRPDLAAAMSVAARSKAARFHWPVVARRYLDLAQHLAPSPGPAAQLTVAGA